MPAVMSGGRAGGRRRTINEINMVPFIDVMLVLLIIFMVSAPLITTGVVDLPSVGKSKQQPKKVIEVVVAKDETLRLRVDNKDVSTMTLKNLADRVSAAQGGDESAPVVISADKAVKYESVVRVMDLLQKAGVQRVGLSVKSNG
ncbi:MAG: protein TolR [Rhizobacter sp.]|jgi:biopolymer transport protein TolR|uniref:Protein TolR n=1 Tax=Piscinibacter gummiphilus TaxID=946333 RepID=A0ABZ0CQC4_9BURK|nr:protein TolR [Piscinibacter gummiphilus]MBX3627853.1 protein TolR [Rhizobacter sp.]WOB07089.1 protein TolR [Piscinibacter gummiphilus]